MYELPDSGRKKKISGSAFTGIKAFLEKEAVRSYYLIWALIFGAGIYAGIRIMPFRQVPGYLYYMIIAVMFLLLAVSLYLYIRRSAYAGRVAGRKKIIFLVFIPAGFFFLCGILVPQANMEKVMPSVGDRHPGCLNNGPIGRKGKQPPGDGVRQYMFCHGRKKFQQ